MCVRARERVACTPAANWIPCFWSGGAETPSTCWSMCWSENSELNDVCCSFSHAETPPHGYAL